MSKPPVLLFSLLIASLIASSAAQTDNFKFRTWFPKYKDEFVNTSAYCETELNDYWTNNRSRCFTVCACAADCLLEHSKETVKSNMAAASVIFGLMPGILALVGPTISEMSLLSTKYPLLAVLLGFASPAVNIMHLFGAPASAASVLGSPARRSMQRWQTWHARLSSSGKAWIRAGECALGLALLANNIQVSFYVDQRTVSGWRCGMKHIPLTWALLGGVVHLIGIVAIRCREDGTPEASAKLDESFGGAWVRRIRQFFVFEAADWERIANAQDGIASEILYFVASLAGIIHMFWGVLVFASLLFAGATDTLPVFARYAASAIVCQAIVLLELATLTSDTQKYETC